MRLPIKQWSQGQAEENILSAPKKATSMYFLKKAKDAENHHRVGVPAKNKLS